MLYAYAKMDLIGALVYAPLRARMWVHSNVWVCVCVYACVCVRPFCIEHGRFNRCIYCKLFTVRSSKVIRKCRREFECKLYICCEGTDRPFNCMI